MDKVYQITVNKDEEIKEKINEFILEKKWDAAVILCGIGSVRDVEYTAPIGSAEGYSIELINCPDPAELVSFTGEIMKAERMPSALRKVYGDTGEYFVHIHAAGAAAGDAVRGGGFQKGYALRAVNIFIRQVPVV